MTTLRWAGRAAVIAAAILWGTTGTVQSLLPPARDPLAVGTLRLVFGAAALGLLALADPPARRALPRLPWRGILGAGIAIAIYNLAFFWAVARAGVGIGTAVAIGSAPIWATAWEMAATGTRPAGRKAAGQALSIVGVAGLGLSAGAGTGSPLGFALALVAGAAYAAYSLATAAVSHRAPSTAIAAATFCVAALLTAPVLALSPLAWIATATDWALIAFLGIGATGLSYALYTWGLGRVTASTAVTLALAEPVTAWLLATFVVGEPISATGLVAVALILGGLAAVTLAPPARS